MIDLDTLSVGQKLGCKYTFTGSTFGSFSNLSLTPNDGRRIKDPLNIDGSYFEFSTTPADPKMFSLGSDIIISTSRTLAVDTTIMTDGTKTETKDTINVNNYKSFISMTTTGSTVITAIPKDQLIKTKVPVNITDYNTGISTVVLTLTNLFCKVAFSIDDGTTWKTYDSTNKVWNTVDLTADTDTLKTAMMDYTVSNALTATEFTALVATNSIAIAMLIGIDGTDTTKTYAITDITIDYIGTDTNTTTTQMFNFIYVGRTTDGKAKFIADKPIQTNISYTTLYTANMHKLVYDTPISIPNSEIGAKFYMRVIDSGQSLSDNSEYDNIILNDSFPRGGKTIPEFWDTNLGSITRTIPTNKDDAGTAAGGILVRGNGYDPAAFTNVTTTTVARAYGFRPVLVIVPNIVADKSIPSFTIVNALSDLGPGKCIECDYVATKGAYGTFSNLGKSSKQYIPINGNIEAPNGRFALNFVGYTHSGNKILMADRVIQTNISYSALINSKPAITGYGIGTVVDDTTFNITMPESIVGNTITDDADSEYEKFTTIPTGSTLTKDQIWHTNGIACFTNTFDDRYKSIIIKGFSEVSYTDTSNKTYYPNRSLETSISASNIGFRPVFIVVASDHMENLKITPYTGYAKTGDATQIKVTGSYVTIEDKIADYSLYNLTTEKEIVAINGIDHTIKVTDLKASVVNTIQIRNANNDVITTFDVFRDPSYRASTKRIFGTRYYGSTYKGITISNIINGVASTVSSYTEGITTDTNGNYIKLDGDINKINIS